MKNLKLILKSIISNNACIEGGRSKRWWFAVIMAVLSLILCMIPSIVSSARETGDSFISGSTNNYENGLLRFVEEINEKGLKMEVRDNEDGKHLVLEYKKDEQTILTADEAWSSVFQNVNTQGLYCYSHTNNDGKVDFQAFYYDGNYTDDKIIIEEGKYVVIDTKDETIPEEKRNAAETVAHKIEKECYYDGDKKVEIDRNSSFIVFGNKYCGAQIFTASGTTTTNLSFSGDYGYFNEGYKINDLEKFTYNDHEYQTGAEALAAGAEVYAKYREHSLESWKDYFRTSYLTTKWRKFWTTNLILVAVNVGIVFFMGLMLFILTRGKANPYRVYNFWDTQKMVYWSTPTPAVIALVIGFIFPTFAQLAFPLLLGVRIMWMSMKSLNPQSGTPVFPKPQKADPKTVKTVKAKPAKR